MDPIYTLIMAAAVVSGAIFLKRSQSSLPIPREDRLAIGFAAFCGAMLGAKLPFVLFGESAAWTAEAWFANGKTILAGLIGGYLAVEVVKWFLDIRTKTGDSFAAPVALSVAIGRLGCFRIGCCHGLPTELPWGVVFTNIDNVPRHPTQLYESAFHLLMVGVLFILRRRQIFPGQLLKLYLIAYALFRLATELVRPEPQILAGLTAYQWTSLSVLPLFGWLWWRDAKLAAKQATGDALPSEQNAL